MTPRRTERGLDRLVNFSDATVAIAITLLILPLVDVAADFEGGDLGALFAENSGTFLAFTITFVVLGRFWMLHHGLFESVRSYTPALLWVNLLWLASIVFLPFASNVLAHADGGHREDAPVYGLYIGTMVVTSASTLWLRVLLVRSDDLLHGAAREDVRLLPSVIAVITLSVTLVLAVLVPQVGMFWLLLLALQRPANALAHRVLRRA